MHAQTMLKQKEKERMDAHIDPFLSKEKIKKKILTVSNLSHSFSQSTQHGFYSNERVLDCTCTLEEKKQNKGRTPGQKNGTECTNSIVIHPKIKKSKNKNKF